MSETKPVPGEKWLTGRPQMDKAVGAAWIVVLFALPYLYLLVPLFRSTQIDEEGVWLQWTLLNLLSFAATGPTLYYAGQRGYLCFAEGANVAYKVIITLLMAAACFLMTELQYTVLQHSPFVLITMVLQGVFCLIIAALWVKPKGDARR